MYVDMKFRNLFNLTSRKLPIGNNYLKYSMNNYINQISYNRISYFTRPESM